MIKADKTHKERVLALLTECFDNNKSINYIVKQDEKRKERIRDLMDYSFEMCVDAEQIYLTEDQKGVVVCHMSEDKLPFLEEAYLTAKLILKVTGIEGVSKALRRERYVNSFHPEHEEYIYLWFIAVDKNEEGKGIGSKMLQEIINQSNKQQKAIYLETSNEGNLRFYQKHGFQIYHVSPEEMFGFKLYFMRRLPDVDNAHLLVSNE
jgi:ribosomal protein S18 acetylase RimI-like enzyme